MAQEAEQRGAQSEPTENPCMEVSGWLNKLSEAIIPNDAYFTSEILNGQPRAMPLALAFPVDSRRIQTKLSASPSSAPFP